MRVPLLWLSDYVSLPVGAEAIAERLTMAGIEVERVESVGNHWGPAVRVGEAAQRPALAALRGGVLLPDDGDLLQLAFGYERFDQVPEERRGSDPGLWEVAQAWFPGGGTPVLEEPFAHLLDDY